MSSSVRCLSTRGGQLSCLEAGFRHLLSQRVALAADADRVIPQLRAEVLLDKQDGLEGRYIYIIIYAPEAPADALASHVEGPINSLTVCSPQHHGTGLIRLQLDPQILRFHQHLQTLQECLVLLGQFHV